VLHGLLVVEIVDADIQTLVVFVVVDPATPRGPVVARACLQGLASHSFSATQQEEIVTAFEKSLENFYDFLYRVGKHSDESFVSQFSCSFHFNFFSKMTTIP
jgi:hypothetical protein